MAEQIITSNEFVLRVAGHEAWLESQERKDETPIGLQMALTGFEISALTLSGTNLSCIELIKCRVVNSTFVDCDLSYATLYETVFENCTFERCSFVKAEMQDGRFASTNLIGCNLSRADLARACMNGVKLVDCNLSQAWLYETDLRHATLNNVDLVGTKLIRTKIHGLRKLSFSSHDLAQIEEIDISADADGTDLLGPDALEVIRERFKQR